MSTRTSKVILTYHNWVEVIVTNKSFRVVEQGKSKVAWIEDVMFPHLGATPHPFTNIEVLPIDTETIH